VFHKGQSPQGLLHVSADAAEFRFGRFQLDPTRRLLRVDGVPARLGARAIDLLLALVQHRHRIVSKSELLDLVWPDVVVEENNLQVQVSALRRLLGPQAIATIPGRGYQFIADIQTRQAAPAAAARSTDPRGQLPAHLPPLFGRDNDLIDAGVQLAAHRVLTLTGPGGIGKTRLALAVAKMVEHDYADGVCVIDLSTVTDPARVGTAAAAALTIDVPAGKPAATQIAAALREQALLLVLDNCEHVLAEAAALVDAIVQRAPRVRVLATSQAPLRIADEQVLRLAPLGLPAPAAANDAIDVERYGALQLFEARSRAAQRGFALTADKVATAVDICRRLDGLPLAIELAAARLPLLGLDGLRRALDERLRVLTAGPRAAPARQQTLRATLQWSHALLTSDEQALFRRLGIFVGGFSLTLAQRVATDTGGDPWVTLDHLGALVDKSLVVVADATPPRYHLLESARAFALEALATADEVDLLEQRRAEAMRDLLDEFDAAIAVAPRYDLLLHTLEPELDNLRAALRWAMAAPARRPLALALLASSNSLWIDADPFGDAIGHYLTVRDWLDDTVPPALAARFRLAFQAIVRTRMLRSAAWGDEAWRALDAYRALDDCIGLYRALCALGGAPRDVIDEARADALLQEADTLEDPAWSPRLRSRRQLALEWFHDLGGRFEAARDAGRQHVALARAAGAIGEIPALSNLADTEFELGNSVEAIALCRQAIARAAALGRPAAAAHAYGNMVPALLARGELDAADAAIRAGRALLVRGLGTAFILLMPLALLAQRRDALSLAVQLVGCADRAYADGGHVMHPPEQRMRTNVLTAASALPDDVVARLHQEGAQWSEDEAFARAGVR